MVWTLERFSDLPLCIHIHIETDFKLSSYLLPFAVCLLNQSLHLQGIQVTRSLWVTMLPTVGVGTRGLRDRRRNCVAQSGSGRGLCLLYTQWAHLPEMWGSSSMGWWQGGNRGAHGRHWIKGVGEEWKEEGEKEKREINVHGGEEAWQVEWRGRNRTSSITAFVRRNQ